MIELIETPCQKTKTANHLFCDTIAEKLNRLEDRQRKEFPKLKIHQLVVQAESMGQSNMEI